MARGKIIIHAVSAKMGGAVNYLRRVAAELHGRTLAREVILWVSPEVETVVRRAAPGFQVKVRHIGGAADRLAFDQLELRRFLKEEKAEVLFSTANIGMLRAPCRQVLLVRNALYFSKEYLDSLHRELPWRLRFSTRARQRMTLASAQSADVVMTPSYALAEDLKRFRHNLRGRLVVNPYGVEAARFAAAPRVERGAEPARLLFTSLYAEHKNLKTLLAAAERLNAEGVPARLVTTGDPRTESGRSPIQEAEAAAARSLAARGLFASPGAVSGDEVVALYGQADLFVYPSVVESFGHPLLEAMAAGLPVVASDVPINRELCGDAARYFPPFDSRVCAEQIKHALQDTTLRTSMIRAGQERAAAFTWSGHVDRLLSAFA